MAILTRVISDTKTHTKVLLNFDNDSATTAAAVDASTLSGHANGAKLHINHIIHSMSGSVEVSFVGSAADVVAIDIVGSNIYYGASIVNNATNTTVTGGDIKVRSVGATGYILLTLQKVGFAENS